MAMDRSERSILTVTCFGHFMTHFNMLFFPALVLPLTQHLQMGMPQVLGLSFWMYLLFGLTALPWGLASDRLGSKPMLVLFFGGAGLSGLAASFWLESPAAFSLALAGLGLFSGIYHPAGLGLISKGVSRVSMGMGINGMFGNLGLALGPLSAGLLNWLWGPAAAYLGLGLLNLAGAVLLLLLPVQEPGDGQAGQGESQGHLKAFLILLVAMMLGGLAYRGATVVLPAYLELKTPQLTDALGQAAAAVFPQGASANLVATAITSAIFLLGIGAQYLGGRAGERYDPRWGYFVCHGLALPAALLMALASELGLVLAAMFYLFFLLGMQPLENTLVARLSPVSFRHSAYGAKFVLTFGIGAVAVELAGWAQGIWGLESVFVGLGLVSACLVATIVLLIKKTGRPARA